MQKRWIGAWAIGLALLAGAASWAQAPEGQRVPQEGPAVEAQAQREAQRSYRPPEPAPVPVRIIQSVDEAEHDAAREAEADKHDAKDLEAQQRAAAAAEAQWWPTWAAVILTALGTALLVWTLLETRKTAKAAAAGVVAADRAAKAAEDAVAASQDTAKRQLRAYVFAGKGTLTGFHEGGMVKATITVKNHGATPAYKARIWLDIEHGFEFAEQTIRITGASVEKKMIMIDLGPGAEYRFTQKHTFTATTMAGIRDGKWVIYAYGGITYVDCFGAEQTGAYRYFYGGSAGLPADGEMSYGHIGNEYS